MIGVRGYDKALARVQRVVEDELGLARATRVRSHDEAVARSGRHAGRRLVEARRRARAGAARRRRRGRACSRSLLAAIEANLPGTLADVDTEFLHDLRVAVRRTRSLQRELKARLPAGRSSSTSARSSAGCRQITGPSRDLDVYLLEFDGSPTRCPRPSGATSSRCARC